MAEFTAGDAVQTPFGKGVVREVRNNGRLCVEVNGRSLELKASDISPLELRRPPARTAGSQINTRSNSPARTPSHRRSHEVDLHGLTTEEALARADRAINDALLADVSQLRFIHGRSGGRIRAALHQWLRGLPSVRRFYIDGWNEGVTIVDL
jgi:DNA mismatch repair protein MutS2